MIRTDIIQKFTESGFLITQEAVMTIQETDLPLDLVNEILKHVDESVVVIAPLHVTAAKESLNSEKKVVRSLAFTQTEDESADVPGNDGSRRDGRDRGASRTSSEATADNSSCGHY